MNMSGMCVLVGTEVYHSQKSNKDYLRVALAQGADVGKFVTEDMRVQKLQPYKEYKCHFSYNAQYDRIQLLSIDSNEK